MSSGGGSYKSSSSSYGGGAGDSGKSDTVGKYLNNICERMASGSPGGRGYASNHHATDKYADKYSSSSSAKKQRTK
jgi:hypothetical protein